MAGNLSALFLVLHLVDSAGTDVLVSTESGVSASTDVPASVPYRPLLRRGTRPVDWKAVRTDQTGDGGRPEGWIDPGGVVAHGAYTFNVANPRDPRDDTRPLDDLVGLDFRRQPATWHACAWILDPATGAYSVPDLADCEIVGRGTVNDAQFQEDSWIIRIREQTSEGLNVPASPVVLAGLGTGIRIQTPSVEPGAKITRADQASLRTTGDQWFALVLYQEVGVTITPFVVFSSPLFRLQIQTNAYRLQLLNAGGQWVTIGTPTGIPATLDTIGLLVNYNASTETGEAFVDGVSQGTTTLVEPPGGLNSTATGDAILQNGGIDGTPRDIVWLAARHGTRNLAASEVFERSRTAFDIRNETSLTMAMEFLEGVGDITADSVVIAGTAGASGVLSSFLDTDAAWIASDSGEASAVNSRPPVVIGRPFDARTITINVAFQDYSIGYDGRAEVKTALWVAADGGRLKPLFSASDTVTFVAATRTLEDVTLLNWPAVGQQLDWSTGLNAGTLTVEQVVLDPVTSDPTFGASTGSIIVEESISSETIAGTLSSIAGDEDWIVAADIPVPGYPVQVRLFTRTDRVVLTPVGSTSDSSLRLASTFLEFLGPTTAPTEVNLRSLNLASTGWQGAGNENSRVYLESLARSTLSTDDSPSVVCRALSDGAWNVRGFDRTPTSPSLTWNEDRIRTASEISPSRTFDAVRMRYARRWGFETSDVAALPPDTFQDRYSAEIGSEFREVTSGTGRELIREVFLLETPDAQAAADALQDIISNGVLYKLELYGPLPKPEVSSVAFDEVTVTWPAHPFLASGRVGTLAGLDVHPDTFAATALVLFIGP